MKHGGAGAAPGTLHVKPDPVPAHITVQHILIGFAGQRTIWATVRLELPEGFQTSEFLLNHGFVDRIVHRKDLRTEIAQVIDYCERKKKSVRCQRDDRMKG